MLEIVLIGRNRDFLLGSLNGPEPGWSRVNDEKVKEGKRLTFPGLRSRPSRSRESARNRETERKKDTGTQALIEQECFIEFCKSKYTGSFFR